MHKHLEQAKQTKQALLARLERQHQHQLDHKPPDIDDIILPDDKSDSQEDANPRNATPPKGPVSQARESARAKLRQSYKQSFSEDEMRATFEQTNKKLQAIFQETDKKMKRESRDRTFYGRWNDMKTDGAGPRHKEVSPQRADAHVDTAKSGTVYLSFWEARKHVISLKLTDRSQFRWWAQSHKRPAGIPYHPKRFYSEKWVSWDHFLGVEPELEHHDALVHPLRRHPKTLPSLPSQTMGPRSNNRQYSSAKVAAAAARSRHRRSNGQHSGTVAAAAANSHHRSRDRSRHRSRKKSGWRRKHHAGNPYSAVLKLHEDNPLIKPHDKGKRKSHREDNSHSSVAKLHAKGKRNSSREENSYSALIKPHAKGKRKSNRKRRSPKASDGRRARTESLLAELRAAVDQAPPLEVTTEADMLALKQVHDRVLSTSHVNPQAYEPLSAENHPEVAASEVVLSSMLLHVRQRERLREHRAQREQRELREACTNKLLMQLRAARERIPPLEEATEEHRKALQRELARVLRISNSDSSLYVSVAADTHPEVATCEKAIEDMLAHEQKVKEEEARLGEDEWTKKWFKLFRLTPTSSLNFLSD